MISRRLSGVWQGLLGVLVLLGMCSTVFASEADINIPPLTEVSFSIFGATVTGIQLMYGGIVICFIGMIFGWIQYQQTKALAVHECMANVSHMIWETCKTYLQQQGKFLTILWLLIAACIFYYFKVLQGNTVGHVIVILLASVLGILGSYGVAWFGIRINTVANSRTAFSAFGGPMDKTVTDPLCCSRNWSAHSIA